MMMRWLAVLAGAWLCLVVVVWLTQDRLLYLPGVGGRDWIATPAELGLEYRELELTTVDDVLLRGWWVPHEDARGALLFFHGNAGNISHRLQTLELFRRLQLSVLLIDYRGYGRSEGRPSEAGTAQDARAAWAWLTEEAGLQPGQILLAGRSLGAAVAAELAREKSPAGVILESPFRSVPVLAQQLYPFLPARWLSRFDYAVEEYVTKIEAPLLVVHSHDDEIVPFSHGQRVHERAANPFGLVELRGGHNTAFLESSADYLGGLHEFLAEVLQSGTDR